MRERADPGVLGNTGWSPEEVKNAGANKDDGGNPEGWWPKIKQDKREDLLRRHRRWRPRRC